MTIAERIFAWVVITSIVMLGVLLLTHSPARAQAVVTICVQTGTGPSCTPVTSTNPLPVTGGGGGSSSSFGAAFPATGTAAGFTDGTNMVGGRVGAVSNVAAATGFLDSLGVCQYLASAPTLTDTRYQQCLMDANGNIKVTGGSGLTFTTATLTAWTSATAPNAMQTVMPISSAYGAAVLVQLDQTTTISAGAITFEGTYDGTNWVTIPAAQVLNANTGASLTNPYTLVASTNQPFLILTQGYQGVRIKLSTQITGSATVTPFVTLLPFEPVASFFLQPIIWPTTTPPVNVAQINGITPLMGNGATGTGSSRMTIANDNTVPTGWPTAANQATANTSLATIATNTGAAIPAGTALIGYTTPDVCSQAVKTNLPISQNGTSSVQLIALSGSTTIYVCSLFLMTNSTATTFAITTGTGSACVTGNAAVMGTTTANIANSMNLIAGAGLTFGNGQGTIGKGAASSELCMILGSNVFVSGNLTYVQQ